MKHTYPIAAALLFFTPAALASDLDLSVESSGSNTVSVAPCSPVFYSIVGELSDGANGGLASFCFDLILPDGSLVAPAPPPLFPMDNFAPPKGLSNPAGYGGTLVGGDLIQVGGAQNTINNSFLSTVLTGSVIPGVAQPPFPVTLVAGALISPSKPGTYTLSISNVSANVIRQGGLAPGLPFVPVDEASAGTVTSLTINVTAFDSSPATVSVGSGGSQSLNLNAGPCNGGRFYLVLGSVTGTTPGLPLGGGVILPLNADAYFNRTLAAPNLPPMGASFGVLNGAGQASASFTLPPGLTVNLVGVTVHHAYVLLTPALDFASDAVSVSLVN